MTNTQSYPNIASRARKGLPSLATLLAVFLTLFAVTASARAFADGPAMTIDATQRDFGDVCKGELLDTVFTVRNDGTAPLTLAEKSLTGRARGSRAARVAVARARPFNDALMPVALMTRRAAPS